ncbi:hypothetical protein GCM10023325_05260 [Sphingomonas lutea]
MRGCLLALGFLAACSGEAPNRPDSNAGAQQTRVRATANPPAPTPAAAPATPARVSTFTQLAETRCRLIEENKEEGPYWLRRCPGHAGWSLEWSESDLRQDLTLIAPSGAKSELGLTGAVANGAFNSIQPTIEWRGPDARTPAALIVRMNVAAGQEGGRPDISRLVVVRLTSSPCPVAVVPPGPGQNARARAIADAPPPACLSAG